MTDQKVNYDELKLRDYRISPEYSKWHGYIIDKITDLDKVVLRKITTRDYKATLFYFDDGVWTATEDVYLLCDHLPYGLKVYDSSMGKFTNEQRVGYSATMPNIVGGVIIDRIIFYRVVQMLKPGDTYETLVEMYNKFESYNAKMAYNINADQQYSRGITGRTLRLAGVSKDVYNFVTKIETPIFEKALDNESSCSFDFIRVYIDVITGYGMPKLNRIEFIKEHTEEFVKIAVTRIKTCGDYRRYGSIPLNFFKISEMMLTRSSELMMLFELKDIV